MKKTFDQILRQIMEEPDKYRREALVRKLPEARDVSFDKWMGFLHPYNAFDHTFSWGHTNFALNELAKHAQTANEWLTVYANTEYRDDLRSLALQKLTEIEQPFAFWLKLYRSGRPVYRESDLEELPLQKLALDKLSACEVPFDELLTLHAEPSVRHRPTDFLTQAIRGMLIKAAVREAAAQPPAGT